MRKAAIEAQRDADVAAINSQREARRRVRRFSR
jgi:hypothetical protein